MFKLAILEDNDSKADWEEAVKERDVIMVKVPESISKPIMDVEDHHLFYVVKHRKSFMESIAEDEMLPFDIISWELEIREPEEESMVRTPDRFK